MPGPWIPSLPLPPWNVSIDGTADEAIREVRAAQLGRRVEPGADVYALFAEHGGGEARAAARRHLQRGAKPAGAGTAAPGTVLVLTTRMNCAGPAVVPRSLTLTNVAVPSVQSPALSDPR